ncbi:hypothetical protein MPSEU_000095700 [Mayamaea pseudoterrestris]|nr:hypothetical protein MPSEU_000095700 [Mayamaea pseudoterrestris]
MKSVRQYNKPLSTSHGSPGVEESPIGHSRRKQIDMNTCIDPPASDKKARTPSFRLRKTPIKDTLNELTAVQRLVEYFIVVSPKPRWSVEEQDGKDGRARQHPRRFFRNRGQSKADLAVTESTSSETLSPTGNNGWNLTDSTDQSKYPTKSDDNKRTEGNIHMPLHRTDHTFAPEITARYPLEDYDDNPLNPMTVQFCFPSGDVIVPTKAYEMPRVHHFALTTERGRKIYGTCLTMMEEYSITPSNPFARMTQEDEDVSTTGVEISFLQKQETLYLPKVLCILSTGPYLTAFREYLGQLYRLATATNMMMCPIERYVVNLCKEIPAPPPGAYEVQVSILDSTIRIWAPPAKLPIAYVALPFQILFECLDLDNIIKLWSAMVLERKILLLSSQHSILGVCAEILCSMLFPFRWSHLYIPLLPRMLCPMLDAPMPYLCGVVRENWLHAQQFVAGDTIVVDLDRNSIVIGQLVQPIPNLPQRKLSKLQATLHDTIGHVFWRARGLEKEYRTMSTKKLHKRVVPTITKDNQWIEKLSGLDHAFNLAYTPDSPNLLEDTLPEDEQNMWLAQEAFLRFFVALMKGYHVFLSIPSRTITKQGGGTVVKPSFNRGGFLDSQKSEAAEFLAEFCLTQHFDDFLTRRMYSPGEPDLIFFDQSIKAKINRSKLKLRKSETPLLQNAKAHKDLQKIKAIAPSGEGLKDVDFSSVLKPYAYKSWPEELNTKLLSIPRPLPKTLVAEFDRQALLVEKLRATIVDDDIANESGEFYGVDFDPSLEVATFTVFLFVYCALVGREWQEYAKRRRQELDSMGVGLDYKIDGEHQQIDQTEGLEEREAVEGLISDIACDACPNEGLVTMMQVLAYCEGGAQDIYSAIFKPAADEVANLQLQLTEAIGLGPKEIGEALDEFDEAREVAAAQLDLAFDILKTMNLRGLSVDSDAYLSLMEACGRCGDTHRALNLIQLMRHDGFAADSEVLACFIAAFVQDGENGVDIGSSHSTRLNANKKTRQDSDAYFSYLKKKLVAAEATAKLRGDTPSSTSIARFYDKAIDGVESADVASVEVKSHSSGGAAILDWLSQYVGPPQNPLMLRKERGRRRRKTVQTPVLNRLVTEMVQRQVALGESLLDFVFPNLSIDTTSDPCPQCSYVLMETDVCMGWTPCGFSDYTTKCPKCLYRFVPQFVVTCSASTFEGSQGSGTPLYCEFLSPWVIRRNLQNIVKGESGIDRLLDPSWRSGTGIQATIFWNLMVHFRRNRLPFSFLLQGSFNSRLILPPLPSDM